MPLSLSKEACCETTQTQFVFNTTIVGKREKKRARQLNVTARKRPARHGGKHQTSCIISCACGVPFLTSASPLLKYSSMLFTERKRPRANIVVARKLFAVTKITHTRRSRVKTIPSQKTVGLYDPFSAQHATKKHARGCKNMYTPQNIPSYNAMWWCAAARYCIDTHRVDIARHQLISECALIKMDALCSCGKREALVYVNQRLHRTLWRRRWATMSKLAGQYARRFGSRHCDTFIVYKYNRLCEAKANVFILHFEG